MHAPEVLAIALFGDRPEEMRKLVDKIREVYINEVVGVDSTARRTRLDKLKNLWNKYDTFQKEKVEKLKAMEEDLGSPNDKIIELKHQFALQQLSSLQTELMQIQMQIRHAQVNRPERPDTDE